MAALQGDRSPVLLPAVGLEALLRDRALGVGGGRKDDGRHGVGDHVVDLGDGVRDERLERLEQRVLEVLGNRAGVGATRGLEQQAVRRVAVEVDVLQAQLAEAVPVERLLQQLELAVRALLRGAEAEGVRVAVAAVVLVDRDRELLELLGVSSHALTNPSLTIPGGASSSGDVEVYIIVKNLTHVNTTFFHRKQTDNGGELIII